MKLINKVNNLDEKFFETNVMRAVKEVRFCMKLCTVEL